MSNLEYKLERTKRGSQDEVAALLGVSRATINRREAGEQPVSREAELAMLHLPIKPAPDSDPNPAQAPFGRGWSSDAYL